MAKNTYQINSLIFDIMNQFYSENDNINEKEYMNLMTQYIHYYCKTEISEEEALATLSETWVNYEHKIMEYRTKYYNNLNFQQILEIILMEKLVEDVDLKIIL
jgi:hypothetical protein